MEEIRYTQPHRYTGQRSAYLFIQIDLPLYAEQCAQLETELEQFFLQKTGEPFEPGVEDDGYGSFRIFVTSNRDGAFDPQKMSQLNLLRKTLFEDHCWEAFAIVESLFQLKRWQEMHEEFEQEDINTSDLIDRVNQLPDLISATLYASAPADMEHQMIEMFESVAGRLLSEDERVEISAPMVALKLCG